MRSRLFVRSREINSSFKIEILAASNLLSAKLSEPSMIRMMELLALKRKSYGAKRGETTQKLEEEAETKMKEKDNTMQRVFTCESKAWAVPIPRAEQNRRERERERERELGVKLSQSCASG
ncbi:hypothetical protein F2Q69_00031507 [Brassica cretica]|uniref:Uncharacterized protein n=1 Tax=Brassica cretica TaxID=69181 RepID=A0A8S9RXA6_BRACR|nr:hypothetical protein F2Q69_00031509 [Brassica cretica]KAF3584519.1 hypothetical protein F2Q69_00031507 [Brassica cretica]